MPFKNAQQRKSCFATNGWGGKVDCHAFAHDKPSPKKSKSASVAKKKKR